jgi:plastocyanin
MDNAFQVDAQGGVADVVVWVDAPAVPLPLGGPVQEVVLDQRRCLYRPAVLAARAGDTLRLRNSDPLTHTVHALRQGQTLFDVAMPLEHSELTRPLPEEPGVLDIRCDVHPWMRATVRTFPHPHFTTTDAGGRYRLPGLVPGEATVHAWHPRLGEASRRVRLSAAATPTDFDFGGKP